MLGRPKFCVNVSPRLDVLPIDLRERHRCDRSTRPRIHRTFPFSLPLQRFRSRRFDLQPYNDPRRKTYLIPLMCAGVATGWQELWPMPQRCTGVARWPVAFMLARRVTSTLDNHARPSCVHPVGWPWVRHRRIVRTLLPLSLAASSCVIRSRHESMSDWPFVMGGGLNAASRTNEHIR